MFTRGLLKIAKMSEDDKSALKRGALIGTSVGAAKNLTQNYYLNLREQKAKNLRSFSKFKKALKPGDILISGSTAQHSGGVTVNSLPKSIQKILRKSGLGKNQKIISNSALLNAVGAGSKYHGAVYLGKGRVAHMTTDVGAVSERLEDALSKQNIAAYRLNKGKGSSQQVRSAVGFAKGVVKNKIPYEGATEYLKEPLANIALPDISRRACRNTAKGMVCHTLPLMAYDKQKFSQGRRTYSGDIRKNLNFTPVARRDVVKVPAGIKIRGTLGHIGKGLSYAAPGAAIAYGLHKYRQSKKENK